MLELAPDHLVDDAGVGLNNADDFGGDVLIDVVGDGDAREAVADEGDGDVHALQEAFGVDAGEDEAALVEGLGALGAGADADGREGMANGGEEGRFLRQGAAVADHTEGVHLQAVVVVEAEGFVLDDAGVEFEAGGFEALAGAWVAGVQDWHVVLLRHLVDSIKQRQEVLLRVDVLLAVSRKQDILTLLKPKPSVNVRSLNLCKVVMQHLRHRGAGYIRPLLRQTRISQIAARVLRVRHVHIGDDVHDAAVGLLGQALVLTTVARLHMENGNVKPLSADDAQTRISVPQHQHGVRLNLNHQLIALGDDIAHGLAQVCTHGVHVHIRIRQLEVLEKHPVEVIVIVLPSVCQQAVEVLATFIDYGREADNLRARADDDEKLKFSVVLELCHIIVLFVSFVEMPDQVGHDGY